MTGSADEKSWLTVCTRCMRLLGPGVLHAVLCARSSPATCALSLCGPGSASDRAVLSPLWSLNEALPAAALGTGACFLRAEGALLDGSLPDEAFPDLLVAALRIQSASSTATEITCCMLSPAVLPSSRPDRIMSSPVGQHSDCMSACA